jgi:ubiquitin-protein ligase
MSSDGSAVKRLPKELKMLSKKPVPGVRFEIPDEGNWLTWTVHITAPEKYLVGSDERPCPYGGKEFPFTFKFPAQYPFKPPEITAPPKALFHPNVDFETGELCADMIKDAHAPTKNVGHLATMVMEFLRQPNLEHPFNEDSAGLMSRDVDAYEARAREAAAAL